MKKNLRDWLRLRFNLHPIDKHIVYHRVSKTPWYYGDGASLLALLGTLILTGMFMALTYSPSPDTAYISVLQITHESYLGWFVRGLHYWSAGMSLVILLYHMLRHIALGGYLPPREGIWLIGVFLFFLMIMTSLIGYILRWDERSLYALGVALNIFYKIPWIGDEIVRFVQGGWDMGAHTLSRLYAVHVLFVPFTLLALLGYHIYLVLAYGATTPLEKKYAPETAEEQIELRQKEIHHPQHGQDFFPYVVAKSGTVAFVVILLVVLLTLIKGPQDLYPEANWTRVSFPQEEWWFHWYSALTAYLPSSISDNFHWLFPLFIFLILFFLPLVDHGANRAPQRRPLALVSVALTICLVLGLTGLRLSSRWTAWPRKELAPLPEGVTLTSDAEEGRRLFTQFGCFNCHGVGGHGSGFAPNLSGIKKRLGMDELQNFISEPPTPIAMPRYKDKLTPEELQKIAAFVLVLQTFPKEYP